MNSRMYHWSMIHFRILHVHIPTNTHLFTVSPDAIVFSLTRRPVSADEIIEVLLREKIIKRMLYNYDEDHVNAFEATDKFRERTPITAHRPTVEIYTHCVLYILNIYINKDI